ncbi:MAG: hypothetical protein JWQ64_3416 [Subtercola sp.]|nr:hypothetical protein [Subtercola sp.]
MRMGIAPAGSRNAGVAISMAEYADQLGFSELWLSEDYLERGAFAVAGGVAARTTQITIGLGVINPWTRHVALTAMECAALDEISSGRLIVGLGASNAGWMHGKLGIAFDKPIGHLIEYTEALRALLDGQELNRTVGGLHIQAGLSFQPRKHIPVYLGVKGPVALRRGTTIADGLMLSVLSSAPYISWVGAEYEPKRMTAYTFFSCDNDGAAARERIRSRTARFLGMHGATPITALAGIDEKLALQLRERMREGADGADLVTDEVMRTVTVSGTPSDCADAIRRFDQAGLDTLVMMDDGISDPHQFVNAVASVARAAGSF